MPRKFSLASTKTQSATTQHNLEEDQGPPENVVHLSFKHRAEVLSLVTSQTYELFGNVDVEKLLVRCYLSLGLYNNSKQLVGFIMLDSYPNISALPPWDWGSWIVNMYKLEDIFTRNAMWFHLIAWRAGYERVFLQPLLHHLFSQKFFLHYIVMVIPPGVQSLDFMNHLGTVVFPTDKGSHTQCLYVVNHQNFIANYVVRMAVEEDNDELVPLIGRFCPELAENYGDYFVAEILARFKSSGRQIVVAEYDEQLVGVMMLNDNVNYKTLNEEFELMPFNGLKKSHENDTCEIDIDVEQKSEPRMSTRIDSDIKGLSSLFCENEEEISSDSSEYMLVLTSGLYLFQDQDDDELDVNAKSLSDSHLETLRFDPIVRNDTYLNSATSLYSITVKQSESFHGAPNAFAVEVMATIPGHEGSFANLFQGAFQCFPDRDYCVLSCPSIIPANFLKQYFSHAARRPTGEFAHELYILHKNSLLWQQKIKVLSHNDLPHIKKLISTIPNANDDMYLKVCDSLDAETPWSTFVFLNGAHIIGFAVCSPENDAEYLNNNYNLSPYEILNYYRRDELGILEYFILSPIFRIHINFYVREIHRYSQFLVLFHKLYPNVNSETNVYCNLVGKLLHVMPRYKPQYDADSLEEDGYKLSERVTETQEPYFALFLTTASIRSFRLSYMNTKIVISGLKYISLAFLKGLLYDQDYQNQMRFNNVTVIFPSNENDLYQNCNRDTENFLIKKYFVDKKYLDELAIKTYVNFVHGSVVKIDRKEQMVILNHHTQIKYDLLFLMGGETFQPPMKQKHESFSENPENVFIINNEIDVHSALLKIRQIRIKRLMEGTNLIVYGYCLQAYVMIHLLLIYGVPGRSITLVENFPQSAPFPRTYQHNFNMFNDPTIDETVRQYILDQGITIYSSYFFTAWDYNKDLNLISSATFESTHRICNLDCLGFFYYGSKNVSPRFTQIVRRAGLVYDGRVIINKHFQTNDPKIYAAGTLSKYSRRYCAPHMCHKYFNRMEVGKALGTQIREMLAPYLPPKLTNYNQMDLFSIESENLLPRFHKPIMRYCRLPGDLYYLSITKPGRPIPLEAALCRPDFGRVLVTGDCKHLENQGYFRLHLNNHRRVETITCLSISPIDYRNLYNVWGKHEQLLNKLELRFEMLLINDFYDYFREPWAYAIYHDKFNELLTDLNKLLRSKQIAGGVSLIDKVINEFKQGRWQELTPDSEKDLYDYFDSLPIMRTIEKKVIRFIKNNTTHLPMYALPMNMSDQYDNVEKSPLFT